MTTLTAANFNVTNASSTDIANLNQALAYLQQSSAAIPVLNGMVQNHVNINIVHGGAASDNYQSATNKINWDPNGSNLVYNDAKTQTLGVNSSSILLIHEGAHATDPSLATESSDTAEAKAIQLEDQVDANLGEIQRTNHWTKPLPR
jgi:hypothetical protein